MPDDPQLDPYAILAVLGVRTIHALTPVAGGADTALWRVEHDGLTSALRVFRSSQQRTWHRERAAMNLAQQAGLPVPTIRAITIWRERPALLLSWCRGVPLGDMLQRAPWRVVRLGFAFGRMQARIHQINAVALRDQPAADWISWAQIDQPGLHAALGRIAGDATARLHLDYHPLNVLTDGTTITAVLDWANARAGDPRADVARTYTQLVVEPHHAARESFLYTLARRMLAQCWRAGYQHIAGTLRDMPMFYAWADAAMVRDLAPRVTNPDSWWQEHHLNAIRRWTRQWQWRSDQ